MKHKWNIDQEKQHKSYLKRKYGLSKEAYIALYDKQNGLCAICGNPLELWKPHAKISKSIIAHVDHDHTTKRIRGLLCHHCNNGLGCFRDSTHILREAILYLMQGGNNAFHE